MKRGALAAGLAAAAVAVVIPVTSSHAASTVTVSTAGDHDDGTCDHDCTLREALLHTATQTAIILPGRHYVLDPQLGPLESSGDRSVLGAGPGTTVIDGGQQPTSVIEVGGGTLALSGVMVTGGGISGDAPRQGGGIFVATAANLGLVDSRVTGNVAAVAGGGIYSEGTVAVSASTIDGNTVLDGRGGSIDVEPGQAASPTASLAVINSTISGNASVQDSGIWADAPLSLINTTIAGNGGSSSLGFGSNAPGAEIFNTILAASGQNGACSSAVPAGTDASHDIVTDATCGFPGTVPGLQQGVDPKLGALADNGGPTPTHALLAGSPAIDAGDSSFCASPDTDQRGAPRTAGSVCDIGAYEFGSVIPTPTPAPTPTPTPTRPPVLTPTPTPTPTPIPTPTPTPVPPPTFNRTFNALHSKGVVRIKRPHSHRYVLLETGASIPKGTLIDTTKGRVTLVSADKKGRQQHAWFYQGIFRVKGQTRGRRPITLLALAGPKPQCGTTKARKSHATASRKRRRHRSRHLWGNGKGRFRTTGQYSSATVRGTIWLTRDSCKGTLVKVKRGIVAVADFTRHRTFLVRAGHHHLSHPPRKRP